MTWAIKGEMMVNCNCAVFCPCVISLGKHPPTEGYCQAWFGLRVDQGAFDGVLQLAHISLPLVSFQQLHRLFRDAGDPFLVQLTVFL